MVNGSFVRILLAAGQAKRFGGDKLLHPLRDGTPMALAAARSLASACPVWVSVLRPEQTLVATLLRAEGFYTEFDAAARDGMGASLAAAVALSGGARGWLVALADMPWVRPKTMQAVVASLRSGAALAAPYYHGRRGHPVGFSGRWFDELSSLQGDLGARELLASHDRELVALISRDPGVLADVDRPEQLARPPLGLPGRGEREPY
jgi:molybdenum cofactor cytidylyltransferase